MRVLLRARRLDHDSAERGQSVAGEMATMIPDPSRHEGARHVSDRCETPGSFSKEDHSRDGPADRRYGSTRTLRYEKGFEILPAKQRLVRAGSSQTRVCWTPVRSGARI